MKNNQRNKDLCHEVQNLHHKLPEKSNCGDSLPALFSEVRKKIVIGGRKSLLMLMWQPYMVLRPNE